jgi:hypothetical protein
MMTLTTIKGGKVKTYELEKLSYFFNFGQFGGFFLVPSLGIFGFDLVNMPSFYYIF